MNIDFADRTLAHLQSVINTKLQRAEGFHFTWADDPAGGSGRNTIWIHPGIPLSFTFTSSKQALLNQRWLEALIRTANTVTGLEVVPEPPRPPATAHA
ncbi:ATP-dependent DNA ligase [Cryobacterium cryoconiti]|nr:ATP-dependent DNA ligase [Cryobacterium cryoconiti]